MKLWLRDDLARLWLSPDAGMDLDPFVAAQRQQGQIYRDKEGRRTLRFEGARRGYFLKLHQGVGWREIIKNLVQLRLPVVGARNEYKAIRALERIGIDTLAVAGYGEQGLNPAQRLSFLVTDELTNVTSLEDFCRPWPQSSPSPALKRRLIERVARISRDMHGAGINHRDFYLCHFLLNTLTPPTAADIDERPLYLMDLHRAQQRRRVPARWLIKDLGALYYSALDIGLSRRDVLRFMRHYRGRRLPVILPAENDFWREVKARAERIYRRDFGREPVWPL